MFSPDPLMSDSNLRPQPRVDADSKWIVGLDLGQAQDFTAMIVLCRTVQADGLRRYDCPVIKRWTLGTTYPSIVEDLQKGLARLPMPPTLVVDGTGCGRPVVDLIRKAHLPVRNLVPVVITAGAQANYEKGYYHVPKRDLVGAVMAVSQRKLLHIAPALPEAATLMKELRAFRAKITTSRNEQYENDWRVAPHDDMVLAMAMALWQDRAQGGFRMWLSEADCQPAPPPRKFL